MNNDNTQDMPEKAKIPKKLTVVSRLSSVDEDILNTLYGKELYGLIILDAFNECAARTMNVSTLYPILGRMEKQGLISSRVDDGSTLAKGGARRKWYKITQSGLHALSESQRHRNELNQWRPSYGLAINA
jgi:PadR family transcriptional regulator, regulatory protein PadR